MPARPSAAPPLLMRSSCAAHALISALRAHIRAGYKPRPQHRDADQCPDPPSLRSVPPRPGSAIDFRLGHFQRVLSICQHQADASHCPSCSHHSFANAFTSTNSHPPDAHCAEQQTHHVPPDPFHTAPRLLARDRRAGRYRSRRRSSDVQRRRGQGGRIRRVQHPRAGEADGQESCGRTTAQPAGEGGSRHHPSDRTERASDTKIRQE